VSACVYLRYLMCFINMPLWTFIVIEVYFNVVFCTKVRPNFV
jgi:hypothetical protein